MQPRPRDARPRISIVFGVHDPLYAGGLLRRTQKCLDGLIALGNRYRLDLEIIIVEWNPHPGHPPFREGLSWPDSLGTADLRFIEVPSGIHRRLPNADHLPIFEYMAKNVGLRRARGRFLLATNPDLFYSPALIRFLARAELGRGSFYRVDRSDLSGAIPEGRPIAAQLRFCHRHVARVHAYCGSYVPRRGARSSEPDWRTRLERQYKAGRAGARLGDRPAPRPAATLLSPFDGLHRNAAGDFFLMEQRHWQEVRGYPELYTHSHVDAILCWVASSSGLRQTILPGRCRLYHQAHERGRHASFPQTDWRIWYERYLEAVRHGRPMPLNDENWGMAREELREWTAGPRRSLRESEPLRPRELDAAGGHRA